MATTFYRSAFLVGMFLPAMILNPANGHADEEFKAKVAIADLDLQTKQGVKLLNDRIADAAVRVCGLPDGRTIADMTRVWECRQAAIAKATQHADVLIAAAQNGARYVASLPVRSSSSITAPAQ